MKADYRTASNQYYYVVCGIIYDEYKLHKEAYYYLLVYWRCPIKGIMFDVYC